MHAQSIDDWQHEHVFLGAEHDRNERRSWAVVTLCLTMITAEIAGGSLCMIEEIRLAWLSPENAFLPVAIS